MDYYKILGVKKTSSTAEIRAAFRELASKFHPDVNPKHKSFAEARFKTISRAYETLKNKSSRDFYDLCHPQLDAAEAIESVLGDNKGHDILFEINLTAEESFNGCVKKIFIPISERCGECNGTGSIITSEPCMSCHGNGIMIEAVSFVSLNCSACNGKGRAIHYCRNCNGLGVTSYKHCEFEVNVPPMSPSEIVFPEMGEPGFDGYGDLKVKLNLIASDNFEREGDNLKTKLTIPLSLALKGGRAELKCFSKPIKVKIPKGCKPGLIIEHRTGRGKASLLVEIGIDMPVLRSDSIKKIINILREDNEKNS